MFGLYRSIVPTARWAPPRFPTAGAQPGLPDMEIHERGETYVPDACSPLVTDVTCRTRGP